MAARRVDERVTDPLPDTASPAPADRDDVWPALAQLPPRMRAVLVLRYWEDLSEAETAQVLDCSLGTVKSQASRGLARLRAALSGQPEPTSKTESTPRGRA